jgi:DNA-binding MarR family transcriptional regulator
MPENDRLIYLISKAQRLVWNYLNNELKKENVIITPPQTTILFSIMKYGPQSMNALSKLLFIKNSTTTGLIDRLEKNGLVSRNTVGNDRRKWDIAITKKGIKEIIKAKTVVNAVNEEIKKGCTKQEIEAMKKVLKLFNSKFGES